MCVYFFSFLGKVYAVGGHDGNEHLGSMEVFDPLTNKWVVKASMNKKRYCKCVSGVNEGISNTLTASYS